jgi:hypothetical protein
MSNDQSNDTIMVNGVAAFALRIPHASAFLGCGRTRIYELGQAGQLELVKNGKMTLVTAKSLNRLAKSLPRLKLEPKGRVKQRLAGKAKPATATA